MIHKFAPAQAIMAATIGAVLSAPAAAQIVNYTFSSGATTTFSNGSILTGTMTVNFGTSSVTAANLSISAPSTANFTQANLAAFGSFTNTVCGSSRTFYEAQFTAAANTLWLDFVQGNTADPVPGTSGVHTSVTAGGQANVALNSTCGAFNTALATPSSFVPQSTGRSGGAATVLDSIAGTATGSMATAIAALSALPASQQTTALEKLTPIGSRAAAATVQGAMTASLDRISTRLDELRSVGGAWNVAAAQERGMSAGDEAAKYGFWTKAFDAESVQSAKDGFAGYKGRGWGLAFGGDKDFDDGLTAGLALTYGDTGIGYRDSLSGNSMRILSYQLSGYASQTVGSGFVEGMLAYSQQKFSSLRDTVVSGYASGAYRGDQWAVRIGAGMPIALSGDTSVTPIGRIEWTQLHQNAYTESGGPLALSVAGVKSDRLRSSVGGQINHFNNLGDVNVRPYLRAFWNHNFNNAGIDTIASYVGGGTSFTSPGQALDRDTYTVGIGANFYIRENFSANVSLDVDTGSSYRAQTAQATLRWRF